MQFSKVKLWNEASKIFYPYFIVSFPKNTPLTISSIIHGSNFRNTKENPHPSLENNSCELKLPHLPCIDL